MTINDSGLKPLIQRAVLSVSKDSRVSKVLRDARQNESTPSAKLEFPICCQNSANTTLGKNADDGLYYVYCSLSALFVSGSSCAVFTTNLFAAVNVPLSRQIICRQKVVVATLGVFRVEGTYYLYFPLTRKRLAEASAAFSRQITYLHNKPTPRSHIY